MLKRIGACKVAGWLPLFAAAVSVFNGKKLQTNPSGVGSVGDYAWLNALKGAGQWGFSSNANAPVTPDMLDSDGYLKTMAGNASQGVTTVLIVQSQTQKPGHWITKWDGNGVVNNTGTNAVPVEYVITSVTQVGTIQTVNLSSSPNVVAGQPIGLSGIGGTWAGLSNNWRVLDVNRAGNSFRVDSGTSFAGSATLSTPKAAFIDTTTVANVVGSLNGSGRYAVQPANVGGANGFDFHVRVASIQSSSDYPHPIRLVHADDEAALDAGVEEWSPVAKSKYGQFGVIRWLNYQYGVKLNINNLSSWYTRKSRTYFSYSADDRRPELYAAGGSTSLSGKIYSASAPAVDSVTGGAWAGLKDKSTVTTLIAQGSWQSYVASFSTTVPDITATAHNYIVGDRVNFSKFSDNAALPAEFAFQINYWVVSSATNTIRLSATSGGTAIQATSLSAGTVGSNIGLFLNVGTTGSKPILNSTGNFVTEGSWPISGDYRSFATFIYDQTLDAWMKWGGDADYGSIGIVNGAPYETELAVCAAIGAHPYWVIPQMASDPLTDFMPNLMYYARQNKPSWMIPRFEPPNELWNFGFAQTVYANNKAIKYGWGADYHNWYGKVLSTLGQAGATIFGVGNLGTQYQILGAVQTPIAVTGDLGNALPRFGAYKYVAGGVAQSPMSGPWGTITFAAVPASPSSAAPSATQYVTGIATTQYYNSNSYYNTGTQDLPTLSAAFLGTTFTATSISAGTMVVASIEAGQTLANGRTVYVPDGTTFTITSTPGGGGAGSYGISNGTLSVPYSQSYVAGADTTAPGKLADSVVNTVVNATISGNSFTVNSITSGATINLGLPIYGGTIAYASGVSIAGGTYPNFTLNYSSGDHSRDQTASFNVGVNSSLTGLAQLSLAWATWANTNFGLSKITGYEGGYSDDYFDVNYNILTYRSKLTASMQGYTTTNFDNFRGIGTISYPVGITGEFPSVFNTTGLYPSTNAWTVLEDIYQSPTPPQWTAITAY